MRSRVYEAEASLTEERATRARLEREVAELDALWRRDAGRLARLEAELESVREAVADRYRRELADAREEIERLRTGNQVSQRQASSAVQLMAWHRARYRQLADTRPVLLWQRLRGWLGRGAHAGTGSMQADAALVVASGRFDAEWYLATYPDVADARMDPVEHYLAFGAHEGRDPSADFDTAAYRQAHPESAAGMNPLVHAIVADAEALLRTLPDGGAQ